MKSQINVSSTAERSDWFATSLGQSLLSQERQSCGQLVPTGYYPTALQIGASGHNFLEHIEVGVRFVAAQNCDHDDGQDFAIKAEADLQALAAQESVQKVYALPSALPFSDRAHSLIVLPHVLDYCQDPHAVLREVNQILAPEGYIVISGFNQISLWGTMRLSRHCYYNAPWQGHYYRVGRVQDWLSLLGFDIVGARMSAYCLPLQSEKWRNKLEFIDNIGDRWWPGLGASYMVVGKKREIASSAGGRKLAWHRFIPGIARPAGGLSASSRRSRQNPIACGG